MRLNLERGAVPRSFSVRNNMLYSLSRISDGVGDSGRMSTAIIPVYHPDTGDMLSVEYEHNSRPKIGAALRVGSPFAGTFTTQDYWTTTLITEILVDLPNYVKFKTTNSVYEWKLS